MKKKPHQDLIPDTPFYEKHFTFLFNAIIFLSAALYIFRNAQYRTGIVNDDALFVLGARSLTGTLTVPTHVLKPDFPLPGLPLLLSPFVYWVAPHWTHLEWVSVAVAIILLYALARWMREYLSPGECLAALALFGLNPTIAKFSGIIMPSIPYTLIVISSLFLLGQIETRWDVRKAFLLGALMGWGALMRPEGFLLLFSVLVVLLTHRDGRRALWAVLVPLPLWGGFFWYWWEKHHTAITGYGGDVTGLAIFWRDQFLAALPFAGELFRRTVVQGVTSIKLPNTMLTTVIVTLLSAFAAYCVWVGWQSLWKSLPKLRPVLLVIAIFCSSYFTVHLFWHIAVPRYIIPLLPFVFFFGVKGMNQLLARTTSRRQTAAVILALLSISYIYRNTKGLYESTVEANPMKSPPWQALDWIKKNTPPDSLILSGLAPSVELYADRSCIPGILAGNAEMALAVYFDKKISYILDRNMLFLAMDAPGTDNPNNYWTRMRFRFRSYPEVFEKVFEDTHEQSIVYHVKHSPAFYKSYLRIRDAYAAYEAGQLKESKRIALEAMAIYPRLSAAANLLGVIAWKENHFEQAESRFKAAVEYMPTATNAVLNLATLSMQTGRVEMVDHYLQQVRAIAAARGDSARMEAKLVELRRAWSQHQALIMLDRP